MTAESGHRPPPITDSPWYWVYLFGTFALVALVLMSPRYQERQGQVERNYQGRQRAAQHWAGEEPSTPLSRPGETVIPLWPLYVIMTLLLVVGWAGLWWRRRSAARLGPPVTASEVHHVGSVD